MEALEFRLLLTITVDTAVDERDFNIATGDVSLRDAVLEAAPGETIVFSTNPSHGLNGATITLDPDLGQITFGKSLTIDASMLPLGLRIDGGNPTPHHDEPGDGVRIFNITDPTFGAAPPLVTLDNLTLTGADPPGDSGDPEAMISVGGAIRSEGRLVIRNSTFLGNSAHEGGAIFVWVHGGNATPRDVLTIEDSHFEDNQGSSGGGVFVQTGDSDVTKDAIVVSHTTFHSNLAYFGHGGGLYAKLLGGSLTVADSTFSRNEIVGQHGGNGGGLGVELLSAASLRVERSDFLENRAETGDGGGIWAVSYSDSGNPFPTPRAITISQSLISGNEAAYKGGGLYTANFDGTETLVVDSRVTADAHLHSVHVERGGGIYAYLRDDSGGVTELLPAGSR